jgi:hypothetical protein
MQADNIVERQKNSELMTKEKTTSETGNERKIDHMRVTKLQSPGRKTFGLVQIGDFQNEDWEARILEDLGTDTTKIDV